VKEPARLGSRKLARTSLLRRPHAEHRGNTMENIPEGSIDLKTARDWLIDAEIGKRKNASRSPKLRRDLYDRAIPIGRRILEVAILSAQVAHASDPPRIEWEPSWISIRDEAKDAEKALKTTLRALDPKGNCARKLQQPISQTRVGNRKFAARLPDQDRRAKRDALVLIAAQRILAGLANDAERRRLEIIRGLPTKMSDVEKHAFVRALYEGWIYLMGARPGSSTVSEENHFLLFVEAAWQDWRGEGELWESPDKKTSFVRSLNLAQEAVSDAAVKLLVANGPGWL
jgi:hypothetical protein